MGANIIIPIICGSVFLIVICTIFLVKKSKTKKTRKEREQRAKDKKREQMLDDKILNPNIDETAVKASGVKAYDVKYRLDPQNIGTKQGITQKTPMLQIEEVSELSNRKYIVDPSLGITIGSGHEDMITLTDSLVDKSQCEIGVDTRKNGVIYLKNCSQTKKVVLFRQHNKVNVDEKRIRLLSGDEIRIGKVKLIVTFIND